MIYKRGKFYWYKFMWNGQPIRESTKQGNDKVARNMESAHRTSLAKGEVGIREKKVVPPLKDFMENRFHPWALATFRDKPRTQVWYLGGIRRISEFAPLSKARLNEITPETTRAYIAKRQKDGLKTSSINRELQILRRILRLAVEWGALDAAPKIKLLPGEARREHVILPEEEARYLAAAREPLASIATVLIDTGIRPEECFRLRWENITWINGRHGALFVTHGKTAAARRVIPMSHRVRTALESRWISARQPDEGFVWPAETRSGHVETSSVRLQHRYALADGKVRRFVLYSLRHTFLTRLGASGCDVWTLMRIAGHSSINISARYVHPGAEAVLDAIERLGGHKIGHTANSPAQLHGVSAS
ncbi:MAG: tyrosine-type recombinase/integrase [Candidatus Acidiferrales bacterium]